MEDFYPGYCATKAHSDGVLENLEHLWLHQDPCLNWDDITKEFMNSNWKKTLKRLIHHFKRFVKDKNVTKIIKAMVEMANNFNLCVEEDHTEELPEVVPEELTS